MNTHPPHSGSLTLAIETSNPSAAAAPATGQSVAMGLLHDGAATVLARQEVAAATRHEDDLMPAIDRAARAAGVTPRDLALIAVSIGPGGFTALRVAVATAKMLAAVSGGRCIAVPSALAAAHGLDSVEHAFAVALSTKSGTAHVTIFEPGFRTTRTPPEGRVMTAPDIALLRVPLLLADHHFSPELRAAAAGAGIRIAAPTFDATSCLHAAANLDPIDPLHLLPLYAREPEAVTLWRNRKQKT